jgi:spore coat polysaccharide biosynthesis predicted glycosyltransferase SpsG
MSKFPILIRCDATASQGYESFYQCLTYANALQRRRRGIHFLSRLEPNTLLSAIQKGGHDWRPADYPLGSNEDLRQTLGVIRQYQAAAIVVSDPAVSHEYLQALTETGILLVVMDNLASVRYPRCLLLNTLLGPNRNSYDAGGGSQMLMGSRFALVRPFIRRLRPMRAQEPPMPFRVMIAFGDDDFRGQVRERANQLLAISKIERIDVAIRPQHPAFMDLVAMKEANPERFDVITEPADISLRLSRCHLALTSGDSWSLELACIGVPQLMLVQSNWHMLNAQRLDDEGAAINLGDCESVNAAELRQSILGLINEPRDRAAMARAGRKLIDGRGPDRLVNGMEVMLQRPHAVGSAAAGSENIAA